MGRWFIADTKLEASRAPVNELDGTLGLNDGDGGVDIFGDNITTVEEGACHFGGRVSQLILTDIYIKLTVFSFSGVALDHLVASLEAREGHVSNRVLFVVSFLCRDNRSKGSKGEMNSRETRKIVNIGVKEKTLILTEPSWSGIRSSQRSGNHRNAKKR